MSSRKRSRPRKLDEDEINAWAFFAYRTKNQDFLIEDVEDSDDYVPEYDDATILLPKRQKLGEADESPATTAAEAELHSVLNQPLEAVAATTTSTADVDPEPAAPPSKFQRRSGGFVQALSKAKQAHLQQQMLERIEDRTGEIYLKSFPLAVEELNISGDLSQMLYPLMVVINDPTGETVVRMSLFDKAGAIVASAPSLATGDAPKLSLQDLAAISYCTEHNIANIRSYPKKDSPELEVQVFLRTSSFLSDTISDPSHSDKHVFFVRRLVEWAFADDATTLRSLSLDVDHDHPAFSAGIIYENLRPIVMGFKPPPKQPETLEGKLKSELFPHQKAALAWMVDREKALPLAFAPQELESYWRNVTTAAGASFAVNLMTGNLAASVGTHVRDIRGGILADQMGLGKTVEVISLVLANPRPQDELTSLASLYPTVAMTEGDDPGETRCYCGQDEEEDLQEATQICCEYCNSWQHIRCVGFSMENEEKYMCPECHDSNPNLMAIKATLIIVPSRILNQWTDEITKHFQDPSQLKLLLYTGVKNSSDDPATKCRVVRPVQFANYDIVMTTFETLQKEFPHVAAAQTNARNSRRPRRYRVLPSPLLSVQWWRVCIDESQSLKEGATGAARLASRIPAENRWGVSGTPITKGIEDLFGLLQFLQLEPYADRDWWYRTINSKYDEGILNSIQRLHSVMKRVMWRTSKDDVKLDLLEPIEEIHRLRLSEVEKFLYEARYLKCTERVAAILDTEKDTARLIVRKALTNVNSLRQACDHPQLGTNTGFTAIEKATLSMGEMLDQLIIRARSECEDANRIVVVSLNGMAGLQMLQNKPEEAAALYRQVLNMDSEIAVDTSLKIHAAHNLQDALHALHDPQGEIEELKQVEAKFVSKFLAEDEDRLNDSRQAVDILNTQISQLQWLELNADDSWWRRVIDVASESPMLLGRIKSDLETLTSSIGVTIADRFSDYHGLVFTIGQLIEELSEARGAVFAQLTQICLPNPSAKMIAEVGACPECSWLHRSQRTTVRCRFCKANDTIREYGERIYLNTNLKAGEKAKDEDLQAELNAPFAREVDLRDWIKRTDSELERIFSCLATYVQMRHMDADLKQAAADTMKIFTALKREHAALGLWRDRGEEMVLGQSTLQQTTRRMELRQPEEVVDPEEETVRILPATIPTFEHKFNSDRMLALAQLKTAMTRFSYLKKLHAKEISAQQSEMSSCPICTHELDKEVIVWTCGHVFCPSCVEKMIKDASSHRATQIKCPNCRARMNIAEISRVEKSPAPQAAATATTTTTTTTVPINDEMDVEETAQIAIQGSYGTKIDAIVRFIKGLTFKEPDLKLLIFSQWNDILKLVGTALAKNGITFLQFTSGKKGQQTLTKFKTDAKVTCLGLSMERSNQGLTLIEASRVILVEPSLILAHEQQAIGRIYRIGQKKQIHVDRFLIADTVEEQVAELAKTMEGSSGLQTNATGFGANKKEEDLVSAQDITHLLGLDKEEAPGQVRAGSNEEAIDLESVLPLLKQPTNSDPLTRNANLRTLHRNATYWNSLVWYSTEEKGARAKQLPRMEALMRITNKLFVEKLARKQQSAGPASAAVFTQQANAQPVEDEVEELVELSGKLISRLVADVVTSLPLVNEGEPDPTTHSAE